MNKKDIHQRISVFVQAGEISDAFNFLNEQDLDANTRNKATILQSEFKLLVDDELAGTISYEERQMRRNRVNKKLLELFQEEPVTGIKSYFASPLLKVLIPMVLLTVGTLLWWKLSFKPYTCPDFSSNYNNSVLVLPFAKASGQVAAPELILRERINKKTELKKLSTQAKIGSTVQNITTDKASSLAKQCNADLVIWGTYSDRQDSTRIIINYKFSDFTDWSKSSELIAVKDVTELYNGQMLTTLDDAIESLCGLIAIKEGNAPIALKWFENVKEKKEMDEKLLNILRSKQQSK